MDTVHDSQAFIYHHLNMLERPSTPGTGKFSHKMVLWIFQQFPLWGVFSLLLVPIHKMLVRLNVNRTPESV